VGDDRAHRDVASAVGPGTGVASQAANWGRSPTAAWRYGSRQAASGIADGRDPEGHRLPSLRLRPKRASWGRVLERELEDGGVSIRAASKVTIDKEAPEAYKDAAEAVETRQTGRG
jgi:hypothetical protein